ncbi:MBL fold metallo-hydrolase [Ignatzschineria sp. LJL83]
MFEFTLLGTGDVAEIPVFGCDCEVCLAASLDSHLARLACSAMIRIDGDVILLDAGLTDLHRRFQRDEIKGILQTHYHADHAQGMLTLRWGKGNKIPVYGPDDPFGFADLYKNAGILEFKKAWSHGEMRHISGMNVTALNLIHSKPTMGYFIEYFSEPLIAPAFTSLLDMSLDKSIVMNIEKNDAQKRKIPQSIKIAYLTDTVGLPAETMQFLQHHKLDYLIIDCSHPPQETAPKNHNDLNMVKAITAELRCKQVILTHIGHELEAWLQNPKNQAELPNHYIVSYDNMTLKFD